MKIIVLGAGGRGNYYAGYAFRQGFAIDALADRNTALLDKIGAAYGVPPEHRFNDWQDAMEQVGDGDAVIVALPDKLHVEPTLQALSRGAHVLLEKPMATSEEECVRLTEAAEAAGRHLMICHVLRYTPFFSKLRELISGGAIGELVNIELTENVAWWHYAHSFVRGVFRNKQVAAPWILAKSCHDLDILSWLINRPCRSVMSEGGLSRFRAENAPEGAPLRCLDGCPAERECPYFAPRLYLKQINQVSWPTSVLSADDSWPARLQALREGPYGRCVYHCDNDVHDHQSAIFTFEGGVTAAFNMVAFSSENTRILRVFGSRGDIFGHTERAEIRFFDFVRETSEVVPLDTAEAKASGHGGGDALLVDDFLRLVKGETQQVRTSARQSLQSHRMAFAADRSAAEGKRIVLAE